MPSSVSLSVSSPSLMPLRRTLRACDLVSAFGFAFDFAFITGASMAFIGVFMAAFMARMAVTITVIAFFGSVFRLPAFAFPLFPIFNSR